MERSRFAVIFAGVRASVVGGIVAVVEGCVEGGGLADILRVWRGGARGAPVGSMGCGWCGCSGWMRRAWWAGGMCPSVEDGNHGTETERFTRRIRIQFMNLGQSGGQDSKT